MPRPPVVIASLLILVAAVVARAPPATEPNQRKKRIGLFTASLPWLFGPYQNQLHQVSLLLRDLEGEQYDICWTTFASNIALPPGEYTIPDVKKFKQSSIGRALPNVISPGDDIQLDHLTFLGQLSDPPKQEASPASRLNALASEYNLDIILTLFDINRIIPDVPLTVPVVGWVPLHSAHVTKSSLDYWALRSLHGVAALAPSAAIDLESVVGDVPPLAESFRNATDEAAHRDAARRGGKVISPGGREADKPMKYAARSVGKVAVEFIPHIIDRPSLIQSAEKATKMLSFMSAAHVDSALSGKRQPPVLDRGQERTLVSGHDRSLFGNSTSSSCDFERGTIDSKTFVVLSQGGNYDGDDRKGWDTSVQAFVQFYNILRDIHAASANNNEECRINVHLHIHSMDSYLVEADANSNVDAPAAVFPKGHIHHKRLHETGLPRHAYTIDIANHSPHVVAAYKRRASVCLHPSKVEGFGMNVLECQAVGTPVVTTNYTAMADYTKLGRSVPSRQRIKTPQGAYEMAMPDVEGIVIALMELYEEHVVMMSGHNGVAARAKREMEVMASNQWIDSTFSSELVGSKFVSLLHRAEIEFQQRSKAKQKVLQNIPTTGGYQLALGYHTPIVDWDAPWTLIAPDGLEIKDPTTLHRACWEMMMQQSETNVMALPVSTVQGRDTPPMMVKTYMVAGFQNVASRRISLQGMAMQQAVKPQFLPQGLAVLKDESYHVKDEF